MHSASQPKKTLDLADISEHLRSVLSEGRVDEAIEIVLAMLSLLHAKNTDLALKLMRLERLVEEMSEQTGLSATEGEEEALAAERAELTPPIPRQVFPGGGGRRRTCPGG